MATMAYGRLSPGHSYRSEVGKLYNLRPSHICNRIFSIASGFFFSRFFSNQMCLLTIAYLFDFCNHVLNTMYNKHWKCLKASFL